MVSIMTALYFAVLWPQDRIAVKPHASPVFHAIQYQMENQAVTLCTDRTPPQARQNS
jgi:pyruvate dehydrogenase E1 component